MTLFAYEAFSTSGSRVDGILESSTLTEALSQLKRQGLTPFRTEALGLKAEGLGSKAWTRPGRANLRWRAAMASQLATLLLANVALDKALRILEQQAVKAWERETFSGMAKDVASGLPLSAALQRQAVCLAQHEIGLIEAGEHAGALAESLANLATLLEKRVALKDKITSALVYPAFLLTLAPVSLMVIATVLAPSLAPLFDGSGSPMPLTLSVMVALNEEILSRGLLWLSVVSALTAGCVVSLRNGKFTDVTLLLDRLHVLRNLRRKLAAGRICRTLGALLKSGAPLQTALLITSKTFSGGRVHSQIAGARDKVVSGTKLSLALKDIDALSPAILQLVTVGEETNRVPAMLTFAADREERTASETIERMMTLLTPLLTLLLGLLIGGMVMSIMNAILAVNSLALQ
jgi:general secretion pathway protein F